MKIGLFFGSFNPVHSGHLVVAGYMAEFTDLEQVWLVVSPHNPLKATQSLLQEYHRLALVKTGIGTNRKLKASDVEFKLSKPNYTINTLNHLKENFPQHQFALVCGSDLLETFHEWKDHEKILENYEIYAYPRPGSSGGDLIHHPHIKKVEAPLMEISASFIREAIRNKKDVRYMMPESVWNYIEEMHFYER
jgi:nicotinate-nucleotide adenylyltransferase